MDLKWLKKETFSHLHIHSVYSVQDGMNPVKEIVNFAKKQNQRIVAITDHGSMAAFWQLYEQAVKNDLIPLFGCEMYVNQNRKLIPNRDVILKQFDLADKKRIQKVLRRYYHLILLAKNKNGLKNLLKIHNDAWLNGFYYKPTTDNDFVFSNAKDLIASTACFAGEIPQLLMSGNYGAAKYTVEQFKEAFGDDFYLELMINNFSKQKVLNELLIKLARETKTDLIFTGDAHYLKKQDYKFHSLVLNIGSRSDNSNKTWEFDCTDLYVKTLNEFYNDWKKTHKSKIFTEFVFQECLENIEAISDSIEPIYLESQPRLPEYKNALDELKKRVIISFNNKLETGVIKISDKQKYMNRLIFEIETIEAMQATSYVLLFSDIVNFCDNPRETPNIPEDIKKGLPEKILRGTGRGSVGGSLVAWFLNITQGVDPLKFDLLFERFLDINRVPKMKLEN